MGDKPQLLDHAHDVIRWGVHAMKKNVSPNPGMRME
jgi:hypothetical protein